MDGGGYRHIYEDNFQRFQNPKSIKKGKRLLLRGTYVSMLGYEVDKTFQDLD